jgi:hypothetical protein
MPDDCGSLAQGSKACANGVLLTNRVHIKVKGLDNAGRETGECCELRNLMLVECFASHDVDIKILMIECSVAESYTARIRSLSPGEAMRRIPTWIYCSVVVGTRYAA